MVDETILAEMIQNATAAPEPGSTKIGQVISDGNTEALPLPSIIKDISSAGYCYIYDTVTGDQSISNRNMLPTQLKKVRPDGSRVFTTTKPKINVKQGTTKCLLHADSPERAHYDELGLPQCRKSNIKNFHELEGHMRFKHKREWEVIKAEKVEREKREEKEFQHKLYACLMDKQVGSVEEPVENVNIATMYNCSKCDKPHMKTSKLGIEHLEFKKE